MSETRVFVMAEIGQSHDGSVGILHSYIDAIAETGADAAKFQIHIAEAESSLSEQFRTKFSYVDKSRFDYWKRVSLTEEQWQGVKSHCEAVGLEFVASPFSVEAAELLERLGVTRFKIASGEIDNFLMLNLIAATGKEMLISTGMSSYQEIEETLKFLHPYGNSIALFQCTTAYPTMAQDVGLNVLKEMKQRFGLPVGISDHSGTIYPSLAAVALGAKFVEAHIVFDTRMFGPDSKASLSIENFKLMVEGIRFLETALKYPVNKDDVHPFSSLRAAFGKSLAARHEFPAGHIIHTNDLESKKPAGMGIPARNYKSILGLSLKHGVSAGSFLQREDFQ